METKLKISEARRKTNEDKIKRGISLSPSFEDKVKTQIGKNFSFFSINDIVFISFKQAIDFLKKKN